MRALFVVLALVASSAAAQTTGTPCINGQNCRIRNLTVTGAVTGDAGTPVLATSGAMNLCVDASTSASSDSLSCLCGQSACRTINGAMSKIPFEVRHPVTVSIDGGNYGGFTLANHVFNPADAGTGAYISIAGQVGAFAVATGLADGGVTSVSTDAVGFHVVTDSNNAFTSNDLSSRFLTLTSGTGAGQTLPIISNTATAITVSGTFSPAPVAGTVYAITTPATKLTSAVNQSATFGTAAGTGAAVVLAELNAQRGGSAITVNLQDFEVSGSIAGVRTTNAPGSTQLLRARIAPTNQTGVLVTGAVNLTLSRSVLSTGSSSGLVAGNADLSSSGAVLFSSTFMTSSSSNGVVTSATFPAGPFIRLVSSETVNTSGSGVVVSGVGGPLWGQMSGGRLRCTTATTSVGLRVVNTNGALGRFHVTGTTPSIEGCATGVRADGEGQSLLVNGNATLLSNTLAVNATGGARVVFQTSVPTFTTNTTDLSVDGTTSTRAAFVALTPNLISSSYGSAVYLQP